MKYKYVDNQYDYWGRLSPYLYSVEHYTVKLEHLRVLLWRGIVSHRLFLFHFFVQVRFLVLGES